MTQHDVFMALALDEAKKAATQGEIPVGAVVVKDGQVIAAAHNEREKNACALSHAEILAIYRACRALGDWRLSGCTLYVTLEPCAMCAGAIGQSRLDRVVYGAYDEKAGCAGSVYELCGDRRLAHHTVIIGGVMEQECRRVLSDFFRVSR